MTSYYIVSELHDDNQTWAVTSQDGKVVVEPFTKGETQSWEIRFQQGKTKAGIAFVSNEEQAIAYTSNNGPLGLVPFSATADNDNSIWLIDSNTPNPWYLIVNPEHTMGQIWDIHGGSAANSTPIYTWNQNGGSNQRWRFEAAGG